MHWTRPLIVLLAVAIAIIASACSKPAAPGGWSFLDTGTSDAFYLANFVDENVGWLNGQTDRSFSLPGKTLTRIRTRAPPSPVKKLKTL